MSANEWKRTVTAIADRYGCKVERTGSGHLKLKHPFGWFVFTAGTPTSTRSARRFLETDIRRAMTLGEGVAVSHDENKARPVPTTAGASSSSAAPGRAMARRRALEPGAVVAFDRAMVECGWVQEVPR